MANSKNHSGNYNYFTPVAQVQEPIKLLETFDNEKAAKNPVAKVNKFFRKAVRRSTGKHSPEPKEKKGAPIVPPAAAYDSGSGALAPPLPARTTPMSPAPPSAKMKIPSPEIGLSATAATEAVAPPAIASSQKAPKTPSIGCSSMAQDLLELKDQFGAALTIPSLRAKNAPTSFLTGTDNEAAAFTTSCSNEPTPFQLEIPSLSEVVTIARLNEFVENYRRHDQNLDLKQFVGLNRMELQRKIDNSNNLSNSSADNHNAMVKEHVAVVQSLLECISAGDEISVQGFLTEAGNPHADSRVEAVVFQGQRNFTVVFRGTTEQQGKVLGSSKSKKRAVPLDSDTKAYNPSPSAATAAVEVYSGFLESYAKIEAECFRLIDQLVDDNPFCDFVFSGYSFGAAMATLAAFRYAQARPMMRVGCLTMASPKIGFSHFQQVVNSTPNLKVMRLELGGSSESKCQGPTPGGWHVGHTLVLNSRSHNHNSNTANINDIPKSRSKSPARGISPSTSFEKSSKEEKKPSVSVYKFETPKHKSGGLFKTSNPGLKKYISILEDLATFENNNKTVATDVWPRDFANNAGEGVVVSNEKRLMV